MKNLFLLLGKILLTMILIVQATTADDEIVNASKTFWNKGIIRYWYRQNAADPCHTWLFVGVGTGMSVNDYHKIAESTLKYNPDATVIFADANPRVVVKFFSFQYKALANYVYRRSTRIFPDTCKEPPKEVIIGGHSASGRAAMLATGFDFTPSGFIGLDPWWICPGKDDGVSASGGLLSQTLCGKKPSPVNASLPSLLFGYTNKTCGVNPNIAALAAYKLTGSDHRVLYQIHNPATSINHCAFTDAGCPGVYFGNITLGCPIQSYDFVYDLVGRAVERFVKAFRDHSLFHRQQFDLSIPANNVSFLVDGDLPALSQ